MEAWLSQHFINSSLIAGGALLIGVPIIIHLINRMRFRRVKFAAMEFLLNSQKKNRRRVLLEQLLLLLLRICAVAAVVALIARPILPKDLPLFGEQEIQHVVLIDDSGSMRDMLGETTAFDAAKKIAKEIASEGERRPEIHKLTLILASQPSQPVFTLQNLDSEFLAEMQSRLETIQCSHRRFNLVDGVKAAQEILVEQKGSVLNFHFISDFRDPEWTEDAALATAVHDMAAAGISTNLARTVPERHANLAVTELSGQLQIAAAEIPLRLRVKVESFSDRVVENVRVALTVDGTKLPRNLVIPKLEAGQTATQEFDVTFLTAGPHDVRARVIGAEDSLEEDNTRFLAVDVAAQHRVLVIDGHVNRSSAEYLEDALEPAPGITGFDVLSEDVEYLRRNPLNGFRNIVLLNVGQLPADSVRFLEEYVAAGGGLAWFMGDQVRPAFYDDVLYNKGEGLFPVPITFIKDLPEDLGESTDDFRFEKHPLFANFEGQDNPFLADVRVNKYFAVDEDFEPGPNTRIIGRFRDGAPAFIEHRFGRGRIITFLSSGGPDWTNWPRNPSYVIFQLELQKYLAESAAAEANYITGEPITIPIDPTLHTGEAEIRLPSAGGADVIRLRGGEARAADDQAETTTAKNGVITYTDTDLPGIYEITRTHRDQTTDVRRKTYNFPTGEESPLALAATDVMKSRIGNDVEVHVHDVGASGWIDGEEAGQEMRNWLLRILLFVLLAEQLLAKRLSFHSTQSGVAPLRGNRPTPASRPQRTAAEPAPTTGASA